MKYTKLAIFFTMLSVALLIGCSEEEPTVTTSNRVSFDATQFRFGLEEGATATKTIKVYASNVVGTDRVFNLKVAAASTADPDYYTVPTTVTIPANTNVGEIQINATNFNLGNGKTIVLNIVEQSGLSVGPAITIAIKEVCAPDVNTVTLDIVLDRYGSETTWELYNSALEVIYSGGPYADGADQTVESSEFCLTAGDYTFVIYDQYSDGICCASGNGSYTLKNVTATGSVVLATGGTFGQFETKTFTLQ